MALRELQKYFKTNSTVAIYLKEYTTNELLTNDARVWDMDKLIIETYTEDPLANPDTIDRAELIIVDEIQWYH